ncbi:MAG: GC-type dockerin domain-anchored protein [bacterium]
MCPCGLSDIAGPGLTFGPDRALTADDIILFLNRFFAGFASSDIAGPGQSTTPDGQFTADDIILFLNRFFAGC